MAKMPDHINVTSTTLPPQTTTAVPCNHVFPYWSVIPPTHCPCCGAIFLHRRRLRARTTHRPTVVVCAEAKPRYPRYETTTVTCADTSRVDPSNQRRSTMSHDAESGAALGKQINLSAITAWDKVRALAGTAVVTLTTLGTIDTGSQTANGIIASQARCFRPGVKPSGPATE